VFVPNAAAMQSLQGRAAKLLLLCVGFISIFFFNLYVFHCVLFHWLAGNFFLFSTPSPQTQLQR
jgi:hypothetical protein